MLCLFIVNTRHVAGAELNKHANHYCLWGIRLRCNVFSPGFNSECKQTIQCPRLPPMCLWKSSQGSIQYRLFIICTNAVLYLQRAERVSSSLRLHLRFLVRKTYYPLLATLYFAMRACQGEQETSQVSLKRQSTVLPRRLPEVGPKIQPSSILAVH